MNTILNNYCLFSKRNNSSNDAMATSTDHLLVLSVVNSCSHNPGYPSMRNTGISRNRFVNCNTSKEMPSTTGINKIRFTTLTQSICRDKEINKHSNNDCKYNEATATTIMKASLFLNIFYSQ